MPIKTEPATGGSGEAVAAPVPAMHVRRPAGSWGEARMAAREHARRTTGPERLELVRALAESYQARGFLHRARLLFRFLLRQGVGDSAVRRAYVQLAALTLAPDQTDRLFSQWRDHHDPRAWDRLFCEAAVSSRRYAEALGRWRALRRRNPEDLSVTLNVALAMVEPEGPELALRAISNMRARGAGRAPLLPTLIRLARLAKDEDQLEERLRELLALGPSKEVLPLIFDVFNDRGHFDEALAFCRERDPAQADTGLEIRRAWLLSVSGAEQEGFRLAMKLHDRGLRSLLLASALIQSAAALGQAERALRPAVNTSPSPSHAYAPKHVHALANLYGRHADMGDFLRLALARLDPAHDLGWSYPLLIGRPHSPAERDLLERAEAGWRRGLQRLSTAGAERWTGMSDAAIAEQMSQAAAERPVLHFISRFRNAVGGTERRTLQLARDLAPYARTKLWGTRRPDRTLLEEAPIQLIDESADSVPRGGTLVFVGAFFSLKPWLRLARPERVIVIYNTVEAPALWGFIRSIVHWTGIKPELIYASEQLRAQTGLPGVVDASPLSLSTFAVPHRGSRAGFTVGRHSRDDRGKHHAEDLDVYRAVLDAGAEVRIRGGLCLAGRAPPHPRLQLLAAQPTGVPEFLASLDCFFYRTGSFPETWGRVVFEAMAAGLPVVVGRDGGYANSIEDGVDGFLFDNTAEAIELLRTLHADPDLRARVGHAARIKVEALLGPAARRRAMAFYLLEATHPTGASSG